jgi:hypothetical protein
MDWCDCFNCLQFHDNPAIDKEIHSVVAFMFDIFVDNRNRLLALEFDSSQYHFAGEAFFVSGFEKSWSQRSMYFDGCSNNFAREAIVWAVNILRLNFNTENTETRLRSRSSGTKQGEVRMASTQRTT